MATCFRSKEQGVLADSGSSSKTVRDCNSNKVGLSLPSLNPQSSLVTSVRSRKPLSCSQAEALDNILTDGPFPLKAQSKYNESGYFSRESKLSLYSTSATTENLSSGDEIDAFNKESLEALLVEIAEEFGCCWKEVGRHLLKKECSIENINEDYSKVCEKSYQMLMKWKIENGSKASITDIFKCLNHIGKENVAEKLLGYLPNGVARECEMILLLSPKKIRCESMTTPIHNITEQHKDLTVERQLRLEDDEEIYLCSSNITRTKYLLKEIEEQPKVYRWAARLIINNKQLTQKKKTLRKTNEFLKDLQFKEETVERLKNITETLQDKLHVKHMTFCEERLRCPNCEKTALMRELLEKDLSLLHHELANMIKGSRRLSISGIPTDRIYDLAERAYSVCEEHKKFHAEIVKISKLSRRCSMELLDEMDSQSDSNMFEYPLQCTLNILHHFGRKRKVVQSLTPKERKKSAKKVQRHFSDKSKSRFYVPKVDVQGNMPRPNWPNRIGSKIFPQRKRSSEKKNRLKSKSENREAVKASLTSTSKPSPEDDSLPGKLHPRSNTFPSALATMNSSKPLFYGPEDLDLDDINDDGGMCSAMKDLTISNKMSHVPGQCDTSVTMFKTSSSDSNLQQIIRKNGVTQNPFGTPNRFYDSHSPGVMEILYKEKSIHHRQRSFSNDDIKGVSKHFHDRQSGNATCAQQRSLELNTVSDVLWKTEIDPDTVFFV